MAFPHQDLSSTHRYKTQRGKIGILTANYPIKAPDQVKKAAWKPT
jgi:hypothetical protein